MRVDELEGEDVLEGVHEPARAGGVRGAAAVDGVHDAIEHVARRDLVPREEEHRDGQLCQHDEVEGAIDRDDAQHDAVAQRLPAEGELDLVVGRKGSHASAMVGDRAAASCRSGRIDTSARRRPRARR